jgi:hypothetical protein
MNYNLLIPLLFMVLDAAVHASIVEFDKLNEQVPYLKSILEFHSNVQSSVMVPFFIQFDSSGNLDLFVFLVFLGRKDK